MAAQGLQAAGPDVGCERRGLLAVEVGTQRVSE